MGKRADRRVQSRKSGFEGVVEHQHAPDCTARVFLYPYAGSEPHVPQLFKASSNVSLGEERGLDDPAGLSI